MPPVAASCALFVVVAGTNRARSEEKTEGKACLCILLSPPPPKQFLSRGEGETSLLALFQSPKSCRRKTGGKRKRGAFCLVPKKKPSRQGGVLNEKKEEKTPSLFLHVLLQTFGSFLFSFLPRRNSAYSHWAGNEIAAKEEDRTPAVFIAVKKKAETTAWKSEKKILFKDKTLFVWVVRKKQYRGWLYRMPAPSVTRGLHQSLGTCVEERGREKERGREMSTYTRFDIFAFRIHPAKRRSAPSTTAESFGSIAAASVAVS